MTAGSSTGSVRDRLEVAPEVAAALAEGRPVVALESTLISHGLEYPFNLEGASASEAPFPRPSQSRTAGSESASTPTRWTRWRRRRAGA